MATTGAAEVKAGAVATINGAAGMATAPTPCPFPIPMMCADAAMVGAATGRAGAAGAAMTAAPMLFQCRNRANPACVRAAGVNGCAEAEKAVATANPLLSPLQVRQRHRHIGRRRNPALRAGANRCRASGRTKALPNSRNELRKAAVPGAWHGR